MCRACNVIIPVATWSPVVEAMVTLALFFSFHGWWIWLSDIIPVMFMTFAGAWFARVIFWCIWWSTHFVMPETRDRLISVSAGMVVYMCVREVHPLLWLALHFIQARISQVILNIIRMVAFRMHFRD